MPLDKLLGRIRQDAEAEAARSSREADRQRQEILAEAQKRVEEERERILGAARRRAESVVERAKAAGELEGRKTILTAKQGVIGQALEQAVKRLSELPDAEYREILASMLARSAEGLGGGEIEVIVSKDDRSRVTDAFLESVSDSEELGVEASFRLSDESRLTGGGFVLRKGKIESNATFAALARARREELEAMAAELLFGEE